MHPSNPVAIAQSLEVFDFPAFSESHAQESLPSCCSMRFGHKCMADDHDVSRLFGNSVAAPPGRNALMGGAPLSPLGEPSGPRAMPAGGAAPKTAPWTLSAVAYLECIFLLLSWTCISCPHMHISPHAQTRAGVVTCLAMHTSSCPKLRLFCRWPGCLSM